MTATVLAVCASAAPAATVPLDGRTFDSACNAASAGDVITVPAGSYGTQTITCQKAVTFQGQSHPTVAYVAFSGANGPTIDGMTLTGGFESKSSKNVAVRDSNIYNLSYIEGTTDLLMDHNVHTNAPGGTTWSNGDMVDIYEQTNRPINQRITIQDSVFHGLRAPTASSHSDAIQLCNCSSAGDSQHPLAIRILRNKFYDNECMNLRANPQDELLVEGNVFGDTVSGISGCGYFSTDVYYANATVRYNTWVGTQKIQVNPNADVGQSQTWIGNAGIGMSTACGAIRGTYANNVWTSQKCGATDKQVSSLKINSDGSEQLGSPLIDAGSMSTYPATDFDDVPRYSGAAPDAGAFEYGSGATTPPPPADTTPPDTTITSAPASGTPTTASIAFTASEAGSTFQCKLDAGTYAACTSPRSYSGLTAGTHDFSVRATDAAGNTDATPASTTWTITAPDTTPPTVTITSKPSSVTPSVSTSASFAFTGADDLTPAAGLAFRCTLDGSPAAACTSPTTVGGLGLGFHTFTVTAVDAAGNASTPASATWSVVAQTTTNNGNGNGGGKGNGGGGGGPKSTTTTTTATLADTATATPLIAPTVSLLQPTTGTRFRSTLKAAAAATDDGTVDHVEFWLDGRRFGYDTRAPYAARLSTNKVRVGAHTLVARAVDDQGLAASLGTAVDRVRGASTARSKVVRAASTTTDASTALLATAPTGGRVAVGLARCADRAAKVIARVTLPVGRSGHAGTTVATGRLCVAAVALRG